ncbi:nicotinate-nucleotide adenylyltransferase [Flavivirga spongiicola]|uniref:Nicotinate-nucleotide adenylyltransferase n=1 Tax=Flavivirga spongiicola TaxID=421621 RepID=A0ABU7XZ53_9FLAO|nr:nicotinate-nucleotide adenylyltransferase [Flavivirga sp. MEBiC05379]MDO5980852.1 nicotinate-nucleotide adenylyltransferase [Flavivirga sp. MEBiC05379]
MEKILFGLFIFGLTAQVNSQTIELPNTLISVNYKYLDATDSDNAPKEVKRLEDEILNYNHKEISKLYNDTDKVYEVSFSVPKGKIVAAYDKNGKIIRTNEKYYNVRLPLEVAQAISKRFPNWGIIEDVYLIKYHCDKDSLKQEYKVKIKNNTEIIKVRTDEKGIFL